MVIVTEPPAGMLPFQCTVLPATEVTPRCRPDVCGASELVVTEPDAALTDSTVSDAGTMSTNSSPGLSSCGLAPLFVIVTVYVNVVPGTALVTEAVIVGAVIVAGEVETNVVGSDAPPTDGSSVSAVDSFVPF